MFDSVIVERVGLKLSLGHESQGLICFADPNFLFPVLLNPFVPLLDVDRVDTSVMGLCATGVNTS